ncbi:hypothetical protein REPUB_Repub13aG0192500 [Reevesia pubescens]
MPLIYSALILIIGTILIAIIVFTFVMVGNCANLAGSLSRSTSSLVGDHSKSSSAHLNLTPYSASSFRYKKGQLENEEEATYHQEIIECVVCLLGFEDDEEVRQLHRCKHSFHAPCIDMWMYTHNNCPICRTPVDRRAALDFRSDDNSYTAEVLTDASISP